MKALGSLQDVKDLIGGDAQTSGWMLVDQSLVTQFGELTRDGQWIHMDPERARLESPFGATIAHGFLTLSLLSHFYGSCFSFPNRKAGVNYGLDKLRFISPVRTGDRVRGSFALESTRDISASELECRWNAVIEIENRSKPALAAAWLLRMTY